jgi:hypothetical protein
MLTKPMHESEEIMATAGGYRSQCEAIQATRTRFAKPPKKALRWLSSMGCNESSDVKRHHPPEGFIL